MCEELAAEHGSAPLFLHCDIRDVPALEAAIARAGVENGDIAVLLNNAGNDERHAVEDVTVEYWDDRMAINQRPMFFAAQAVLPQMKRLGGGSIVNFGPIAWRLGQGVFPAYVTAKASVHGLTRGLARAFGPFNIRVNSLLPGWVMTERQLALWMTPGGRRRAARRPVPRPAHPARGRGGDGALPRFRRRPCLHRAGVHRRRGVVQLDRAAVLRLRPPR